ncbi:uncharacterized protein LOC117890326 [Drosophila subobscura]|uniref:uncharacterized protein LOC117890326 n=1 Tax=Drosophila subobscura TaxID=7241 RepID=UPI00155AA2C9|nr:uncharacterized protein LOC117890326 [Drosophila subobscura]
MEMDMKKGVLLFKEDNNGVVTTVHLTPLVNLDTKFQCGHCGNKYMYSGPFSNHVRACKRRSELDADRKSQEDKPKLKICDKRVSSSDEISMNGPKKRRKTKELTGSRIQLEKKTPRTIKKVHTCFSCQQPFTDEFEIGKKSLRYFCNDCTTKIRNEEKTSGPIKSKVPFLCEECGMSYKLEANLMRHKSVCKVLIENRLQNDSIC